MMKLREVDNVNDGPSLGRVVEVSKEHGKAILALQRRRGYTAWEEALKDAEVNATLYPSVDSPERDTEQPETPATAE